MNALVQEILDGNDWRPFDGHEIPIAWPMGRGVRFVRDGELPRLYAVVQSVWAWRGYIITGPGYHEGSISQEEYEALKALCEGG